MAIWLLFFLLPQIVVSGSLVKFLPGFDGPLPFELETGYIGVGESEDVQLFYYFIKSERNPKEDPLLIWSSGGPGCSSWSGLVYEIGPLTFKLAEYSGDVPALVSNPYSWTKVASIIFVDSPAGAGFSYARTVLASFTSDWKQVYQIEEFLRRWLMDHPELLSNPFYVGGDSYAGMIVPGVVQKISKGNEQGIKPFINLQGYVLGNPATNRSFDKNFVVPYAHGMGLISDELFESLERNCGGQYTRVDPRNSRCLKDIDASNMCIAGLYPAHVLIPSCELDFPKPHLTKFSQTRYLQEFLCLELLVPSPNCYTYRYVLSSYWANDESVRRALHVREGSIGRWVRCNYDIPYTEDLGSTIPSHRYNSVKGYRSLVYRYAETIPPTRAVAFTMNPLFDSGDHDIILPFLGTQAWIRGLNYSVIDDWRPWMINSQVAGYTRTYANRMTFATVKGGGHTAEYTPATCSVMFERWIHGHPL